MVVTFPMESKKSKYTILGLVVLAFLVMIPFLWNNPILLNLFILTYLYAYLAMSWNIVGGFAGQLSMGHSAFTVIGAYVSTIVFLSYGVTPWVGMFIGGLFACVLSVIIGYPCFKLRGAYYALSTLAFAELIRVFIMNTDQILCFELKAASGLLLPVMGHAPAYFQFVDKRYYYFIILGFCLVLITIIYFITKSRLGYYLAAIREDQEAAEALGINVTRCKLMAAIISGFFTALGGVFYAQYVSFISAQNIGGMHISFEMVFMSIVGGKGTILGPVLGSFLLTPVAEFTRSYLGGHFLGGHLVLYGTVLILVIKFMPSGIISPLKKLFSKLF
jgi:branched-chain amino acid transport system permease protein